MRLTRTGDGSSETVRWHAGEPAENVRRHPGESSQAAGWHAGDPSGAVRSAGESCDRRPAPSSAATVRSRDTAPPGRSLTWVTDQNVPHAVRSVLQEILRERVRDCAALDAVFAEDVAERVAAFTLDGGKMMRSQLLWWGLRACGGGAGPGEGDTALRLAAGLELIQTCALVHDDVMDGSVVRRGRPALHVALGRRYGSGGAPGPGEPFGKAAAVLAGDLALSWADDLAAETWDTVRSAGGAWARVHAVWRTMRTEMVAGQYLDLHGQVTGSRAVGTAIRTAMLKSALYSVERPLALGAALAGADDRTSGALCAAGRSAGLAFQLRDDLLGVFGDPRVTGKPSGDDIRDGKLTYLTAIARARAVASGNRAVVELLDSSVGDATLDEGGVERVREALVETGARDLVEARIGRLVAVSNRHLTSAALAPQGESRLRALLGAVAGLPLVAHTPPVAESGAASAHGPATAAAAGSVSPLGSASEARTASSRGSAPAAAAGSASAHGPASEAGSAAAPAAAGVRARHTTGRPHPAGPWKRRPDEDPDAP
ncbi:polyprenyl synthetase family protein [Streptomyces sp. NPDC091272]|uniref:polyprenyl synthetase family protein n=1 Tax=Streptomyces sp. NPDC091272 TaxID=3365981 RepID=UPI0038019BF3